MASAQEQFRRDTISEQDFLSRMHSIQAAMRADNPRPTPLPPPVNAPISLIPAGVPLPSQADRVGSGPWPIAYGSAGAFRFFQEDSGSSANAAVPLWAALSEEQKEPYRARAEARRREAWGHYERRLARKDAGIPFPLPANPAPPPPGSLMRLAVFGVAYPNPNPELPYSGFEAFRDELVAGDGALGFWDVLARWEALTDNQREPYESRARQVRNPMRPAWVQ